MSICLQKLINIMFYSRPIPNIINIIVCTLDSTYIVIYILCITMYVSVCLQKLINIRFYSRPIPNIINIIVLLLVLHDYISYVCVGVSSKTT